MTWLKSGCPKNNTRLFVPCQTSLRRTEQTEPTPFSVMNKPTGALGVCLLLLLLNESVQYNATEKEDYSNVDEAEVLSLFADYQKNFNKVYPDQQEAQRRLNAFRESLKRITRLNKEDTAVYGLTKFSDLTQQEFWDAYSRPMHRGKPIVRDPEIIRTKYNLGTNLEARRYTTSFTNDCDWREPSTCNSTIKNVLTPVVNQNNCGGCYAYAAIETLASRFALDGYNLTALSVSQILDCDTGAYMSPVMSRHSFCFFVVASW